MVHLTGLTVRTADSGEPCAERPAEPAVENLPSAQQHPGGPLAGLSVRAPRRKAETSADGHHAAQAKSGPASGALERLRRAFKPGVDRLYGLDSVREDVQEHLEDHLAADPPEASSDVTVDRLNNRLGLSLPDRPDQTGRSLQAFRPDASAHPADRAFHAFLTEREGEHGKSFDFRLKDDRIRRACKLAIEFAAQQGGTVHFLLGGMQSTMDNIVNKRNFSQHGNKDFTASELRYVYRNRDRLRDSVQFYDSRLEPIDAPWESDPELWSQYRPHETSHSWPRVVGSLQATPLSQSALNSKPITPAGRPAMALDFGALSSQLSRLTQRSPSPLSGTDDESEAGRAAPDSDA